MLEHCWLTYFAVSATARVVYGFDLRRRTRATYIVLCLPYLNYLPSQCAHCSLPDSTRICSAHRRWIPRAINFATPPAYAYYLCLPRLPYTRHPMPALLPGGCCSGHAMLCPHCSLLSILCMVIHLPPVYLQARPLIPITSGHITYHSLHSAFHQHCACMRFFLLPFPFDTPVLIIRILLLLTVLIWITTYLQTASNVH